MPDRPDDNHAPDATRATPRSGKPSGARRIGPYRIEGELGRGGMGVVHRAFDERLHRDVALKALPPELASDAVQLARLTREARALALVSHANVAAIHGMEEADGATYLVLELVEGETLRSQLDRGALPHDEALALCAQVASGLAAVHAKGLVHRDLKPSNVMVTPDGIAKLLDFGLARQAREAARGDVTRYGEVVGTAGWMSPEQLRGEDVDARSDAFAWGCLLYECLTGAAAFPGKTWTDRDAAVLKDEPAWERLPELHPGVAELLKSCLSKDRASRPATLDEVRRALEDARMRSTERRALDVLPKHSLPTERDAFVGREADMADLASRLDQGAHLVSVLGIGGTGKTRLVLHLAWTRLASWPGGAWFCDLSEARSLDGICSAVARGLDVALGKDDPIVQLGHAIAGRDKCLVILDNFEQVARHAPGTLGKWLDRAPEAQFVVTTREVLGLPGETSLALAPLREDEAVSLFAARAAQAKRDFVLTDADRSDARALVKLLDMLPLGIELAAARVRVMPPKMLLQRMSERFKLLTSSGGRHTRQATLRATLDWSWELLAPDEQQALAQLSVFESGFTLEAAEAVLSLSEAWPADAVQSLVDKSLVLRAGDERFDLLVSVQEYATEKLQALGGRAEAEARHGAHFATLGTDEAIDALDTHGGSARRGALALELANLVSACRRAASRADAGVAFATFTAAASVLGLKGPLSLAEELGSLVLSLATLRASERARALRTAGSGLWSLGKMNEGRRNFEESLAIIREIGERRYEGSVLSGLGLLCFSMGRMEEALTVSRQALATAREVGDRRSEGGTLCNLGNMHRNQGRLDEAMECIVESLAIFREVGNRRFEGNALSALGALFLDKGQIDDAIACYRESLAVHAEVGNRRNHGVALGNMGVMLREQGSLDEALRCYQAAHAIALETGDRHLEGNVLGNLADLHADQGRLDEALRCCHEALVVIRETGLRRNEGYVLASMGGLHVRCGRMDEARAAIDGSEVLLRAVGDPVGLAQLHLDRARLEAACGRADASRAALAAAAALAERIAAPPGSPLGRKLATVRAEFAADPGSPAG